MNIEIYKRVDMDRWNLSDRLEHKLLYFFYFRLNDACESYERYSNDDNYDGIREIWNVINQLYSVKYDDYFHSIPKIEEVA